MRKTNILITIDTEFSIGGYFEDKRNKPVPADRIIYCKINGREYGINLIMDILDEYGLKGVFFVETEARFYFGEHAIIDIIKHIQTRGHEVQLHTHPNFRTFLGNGRMPDDMRKYPLQEQTVIIKDAIHFLNLNGIENIIAHRSGGFFSDYNTVKAQMSSGLKFSSNYNIAFPNCNYIDQYPRQNDIFQIENLYEVPITCYNEFKIRKKWNSFQLSAASFREIRDALNYYHSIGLQLITFITHSFEFVEKKDVQYNSIRALNYLIKRFKNICEFIAKNEDKYSVITFKDLEKLILSGRLSFQRKANNYYKSSFFKTIGRYFENNIGL